LHSRMELQISLQNETAALNRTAVNQRLGHRRLVT
jgi:hypothetical protein